MPEIRTKKWAMDPEERGKICAHESTPYRGAMPCTGPRVCIMCGMEFWSQEELTEARKEAKVEIMRQYSGKVRLLS